MRFRLFQLLLCACVLLAFVGLLELAERSSSYFDLVPYADTQTVRYRAGVSIRWGREGYGVTSIGPHGMIANKVIPDERRVLFLGDSFTEALQVDDSDKFTEVLQQLYNQQFPLEPVTTLNFAISGQGAAQHVADLSGLAKFYRPKVVVAQLSVYDFWPTDATRKIPAQPAFLTNKDGILAIERKPYTSAASWRERLIQGRLFSTYARASWRLQSLAQQKIGSEGETAPVSAAPIPGEAYYAEFGRVTRFLLTQLAQETETSNAQLAILYTPQTPILQNGRIVREESEISAQYATEREILLAVCRELGLPVWNPTPQLLRYTDTTGQFPLRFRQFTARLRPP